MDLENLTGLLAAAHRLHALGADARLNVVERSNATQALGEEVEERALALIAEVRQVRGYGGYRDDDARALVPVSNGHVNGNGNGVHAEPEPEDDDVDDEPLPALDGPFNGGQVRDLMLRYKDGFIIPELAAELHADYREVKKFVEIWARGKQVEPTGYKVGRHVQYRYVKPASTVVERPKHRPPEKEPPAGLERRATGEPVRVRAMEKLTRKGRSTAGTAHLHRMRDKRYDEMLAAQHKRAAEQRGKAEQARINGAGGKQKRKGNNRNANVAKRIESEARAQAEARNQ